MSSENKKTGYLFENIWTVPNLLSFLRILMVPVFIVLFEKGYTLWAVLVLAVSGLTDLFDGKIARRFNQVSELGKILDPIADKLTQISVAIVLFIVFLTSESESLHAFAWVFLLFVAKELTMLVGGAAMISIGLRPCAADIFGKVSTMAFYLIMLVVVLFGPEIGAFRDYFTLNETVMMVLVVISVILTFVALASYAPDIIKQAKWRFSPEGKAHFKELKLKKLEEKNKK